MQSLLSSSRQLPQPSPFILQHLTQSPELIPNLPEREEEPDPTGQ